MVAEIQDYYSRVRKHADVRFSQELELMQPGVWQFGIIDNNGYKIGFSQPANGET